MTPKKEKALAALLTHATKQEAAAAVNITPRTLQLYLKDPEFQKAYKAAFSNLLTDATRQAQQAISPALYVLKEIMMDKNTAPPARTQAAKNLLDFSLRLTEIGDILERLSALEERSESENWG